MRQMPNGLWEAKFRRQKNNWEKKQIPWTSYKRNTRNYGQCRPSNNEKAIQFRMRIFNGTYPLSLQLKVSNMNIEILRLHEDYVTTTIFTWMLLNGLLLLVHQIFETDRRNVKRRTECFSEEVCTSARKTDRTLSVYKSSSMKSFREPPLIVSFALATFIPGFTEANKATILHCQRTRTKKR